MTNSFTVQSQYGTMICMNGYLPGVSAMGWIVVNK